MVGIVIIKNGIVVETIFENSFCKYKVLCKTDDVNCTYIDETLNELNLSPGDENISQDICISDMKTKTFTIICDENRLLLQKSNNINNDDFWLNKSNLADIVVQIATIPTTIIAGASVMRKENDNEYRVYFAKNKIKKKHLNIKLAEIQGVSLPSSYKMKKDLKLKDLNGELLIKKKNMILSSKSSNSSNIENSKVKKKNKKKIKVNKKKIKVDKKRNLSTYKNNIIPTPKKNSKCNILDTKGNVIIRNVKVMDIEKNVITVFFKPYQVIEEMQNKKPCEICDQFVSAEDDDGDNTPVDPTGFSIYFFFFIQKLKFEKNGFEVSVY